jgi:hypothetical protein
MSEALQIQPRWQVREAALAPVAVAGRGRVAIALAHRLLALDDEWLARLAGVSGDGLLIALGDSSSLVWVDGVVYLGRDSLAPSLLIPTTLEPDVPLALLERALMKRLAGASPIAVLLDPATIASVSLARPISRATLTDWLRTNEATAQA